MSVVLRVFLLAGVICGFIWYGSNYEVALETEASGLDELVQTFLTLAVPAAILILGLCLWIAIVKHTK